MAVVFTEFLQLGTQVPPYVFETDLIEIPRGCDALSPRLRVA